MTSNLVPSTAPSSTIGSALKLQGCIRVEEDLLVEGYIEGPLRVLGHVRIAAGGVIRGDVVADTIAVEGTVVGQIRSCGEVTVLDGARIHGDIRSPNVSLSHRAQHRGNVTLLKAHPERDRT